MKQRVIKKLVLWLIPLMFAFFSLSFVTAMMKPAVADSSANPYPFKTGVNAFEYGVELTVPAQADYNYTKVYYKPDTALNGVNTFSGIQDGGYIALQVATEQTVAIYVTAWNTTEFGYAGANAIFMKEDGSVVNVYPNGAGIELPAGSRGALILEVAGFGTQDWSSVTLIMANVYVGYAGQQVELGALGYYADNTLTNMAHLTSLNGNTQWLISDNPTGTIATISAKTETATYGMRTGDNAFAYGEAWSVADADDGWAKVYYTPNGKYDLDGANGYLALQVEAVTDVAIYPTVWDNAKEINFKGIPYFVDENGAVSVPVFNIATDHIELKQGARGMLVMPLKAFIADSFSWATTTLFMVNVNATTYGAQSAKLGEVGYYASATADMQKYTDLSVEVAANIIQTNGVSTLEPIAYVSGKFDYDMRTGDNAFAYGAVWSGVQKTEDNAWSKLAIALDEETTLDKENGKLAIQMEIVGDGAFAFLPALWDGNAAESYALGTATFITEDGTPTKYAPVNDNGNVYLSIPAGKGTLVVNLADFGANDTDWSAITTALIVANTVSSYGFTVKVGEVGYYANSTATIEKLVELDSVADFRQFDCFDTSGTNKGTIARIINTEVAPTVRYTSVSASDDIGLLFYVEFPNEADATVTASYTIEGEDGATEVTGIYREAYGCFVFVARVLPKDYQKNVTLSVNETVVATTTVEAYATALANSNQLQEAKDLAAALIEYCEAARLYFDAPETVESKTAFDVDLSSYAAQKTDNEGDVTIESASLTIGSRMSINVYFRTSNIDAVVIDDPNVQVSKVEGQEDLYVATRINIVAKYFYNTYTITIGEDVVKYSAFSYAYEVVEDDTKSAALHNLAVALYNYNVAAVAYFGV